MEKASDIHDMIYKRLATKLGVDKEVVEKVCKSIWEFAADTIRGGKDEQFRIKYLGVFKVKPGRRKYWDEYQKKKQDECIHNEGQQTNLQSDSPSIS